MSAICVAIASDKTYLPGAIGTLAGIRMNLDEDLCLYVVFLHDGLDEASQEQCRLSLGKFRGETTIDFKKIEADFSKYPHFPAATQLTYARLLLPENTSHERIVYIDSDFLVCRSIGPLKDCDVSDCGVAAVVEWGIRTIANDINPGCPFEVDPANPYFNGGLMVLDMLRIQKSGIFDKATNYLKRHPEHCKVWDQSALNFSINGDFEILEECFNFQNARVYFGPIELLSRLHKRSVNIHFVNPKQKPWKKYTNHPAETMFRVLLDEVFPDWKSPEFKKDFLRWRIRQFFVHWYPMLFRMRGRFKKLLGKKWEPDFGAAQNWELFRSDQRNLKVHKAQLDELYSGWRRQIRGAMR